MHKQTVKNTKICENNVESDSSSDDSSDSSVDEKDDVNASNAHQRQKRNVSWCGVDTEQDFPTASVRKVVWPPPSTSSAARQHQSYLDLKNVHIGNPAYGPRMQLYSKTGHFLAVYPNGRVRGTQDENDLHTYLEIVSAGHPGHIKIKGMLTNLYVAMDKRGRLYGEPIQSEEATVFIEAFQGSYNTYLSRKYAHLGWYLGIKKSGKFKRGPKTAYGQNAIRFLPRRTKFE